MVADSSDRVGKGKMRVGLCEERRERESEREEGVRGFFFHCRDGAYSSGPGRVVTVERPRRAWPCLFTRSLLTHPNNRAVAGPFLIRVKRGEASQVERGDSFDKILK